MAFWNKKNDVSTQKEISPDIPIDQRRVNLFAKLFGILCILVGGGVIVAEVLGFISLWHKISQGTIIEENAIAVAGYAAYTVILVLIAAVHLLLGISIIKNQRKYAARTILVLMAATGVVLFLDILVFGIGDITFVLLAIMISQFAISSYLDPSLQEERRLKI